MASQYLGGGVATPTVDSTTPHDTVSEVPPPITSLQAPASNAGSDDPTGGISKEAGGLSSTAGIGSPVPNTQQTVVGSVLETVFGKKERTAEEVDAAAPTTASVIAGEYTTASPGVLAATTGIAAAGPAAVASTAPSMSTQAAEAQTAPPSTEKPGDETKVAESTDAETVEATKQARGGQEGKAMEHEQDPQAAEEAKKKEDHAAAVRENNESIPTAGGEKVGASHEGESKVIPETPSAAGETVASSAGQPDDVTAENTAKNADSGSKPKTKFTDRVKKALHMGDKKDKA